MKRLDYLLRLLAAVLILMLCVGPMAGCSPKGDVVMELDGQSVTANMYAFWLSRYKAFFVYYYMNGAEDMQMWDTVVDETGKTINDTFTGYVKDNARTYAAALYLYNHYGLKLSDADKAQIQADMDDLLAAHDSKSALNAELANYGVNYDILKEIYTIEAKVKQLQDYLFSEKGPEPLTKEQRDAYYEKNYARIEHIFISTGAKYVYEDEMGTYEIDENGNPVTVPLTEEELNAQRTKAVEVVAKLSSGESFSALMEAYNEDTAASLYPDGYYFTRTTNYVEEVISATFELEENAWRMVESDIGYHIIRRLPLGEEAYASTASADFFADFESNLIVERFTEVMTPYMEKVVVHDEIADLYSLKSVKPNYQY